MPSKRIKLEIAFDIVEELWKKRRQFKKPCFIFEYPDYSPLNTDYAKIVSNCSGDAVDAIEEGIEDYQLYTCNKHTFRNIVIGKMFIYDCIKI